jgi:hypothetical protein
MQVPGRVKLRNPITGLPTPYQTGLPSLSRNT